MNMTKPSLEMPANCGKALSEMMEAFQEAAMESGDEHFSWLMGDMARKAKELEDFIVASPLPDDTEATEGQSRIDELEYEVSEHEKEINRLEFEVSELEKQKDSLDRQVDELESAESEYEVHIDRLNSQIEDLENQISEGEGNES